MKCSARWSRQIDIVGYAVVIDSGWLQKIGAPPLRRLCAWLCYYLLRLERGTHAGRVLKIDRVNRWFASIGLPARVQS